MKAVAVGTSNGIECRECGAVFAGTRTEARRGQWEPWSTSTQQALDHGPMVCSDCIGQLLEMVLDAVKKAPASAWEAAPLTDRQMQGFACRYCEDEYTAQVPDGFGKLGQLFACLNCAHA